MVALGVKGLRRGGNSDSFYIYIYIGFYIKREIYTYTEKKKE